MALGRFMGILTYIPMHLDMNGGMNAVWQRSLNYITDIVFYSVVFEIINISTFIR